MFKGIMKNKKVLKYVLIILIILLGILLILQNLLPVRLNRVNEDGKHIHVWLSKDDSDSVKRILAMRERCSANTCGYSRELSFNIGLSTCMIALDDCEGIFYHFCYFDLPKEEMSRLREIVVKYGGYFY